MDIDALRCDSCATVYPMIACGEAEIPWLFSLPDAARLEWSTRYKGFLHDNAREHDRVNRALATETLAATGRRRLATVLNARREHRRQVTELLTSASLDGDDLVPAISQALNSKLPKSQGLNRYSGNVFRDWAWPTAENATALAAVEAIVRADVGKLQGTVLTLGGGACRLPYDMHCRFSPRLSVVLDINPLLMLIACRVVQGKRVPLFEFPLAPLDGESSAILQQCRAPAALTTGHHGEFRFVLGDATEPPFAASSFGAVITPWLIDRLAQDLQDFIPEINRLLPTDGLWVSTGSLSFFREDPCQCYSETEVLELVEQNGFDIVAVDCKNVPYLCSPHSTQGRTERLVTFAAKKRADVPPAARDTRLPAWLLDTSQPVPPSTDTVLGSSSYLLMAQVLAAVNGKRSIIAIAKLVAREYDLTHEECVHAVQRLLIDRWEDASTPPTM